MKQLVLALLMAIALPCLAAAQGDNPCNPDSPAAPAASADKLATQNFGGFSIDLPANGTLNTPSSEGWVEDEQVIFNWFGNDNDPVILIQCRVDSFEDPLTQPAYDIFCDTLLSNWLGDDENYTVVEPSKPASDQDPRRLRKPYGSHTWNLISIDDHSDANGGRIYYSIFCAWSGKDIYTVSFYYMKPLTRQDTSVQDFSMPILSSFRVSGEAAPADAASEEAVAEEN